MCSPAAYEDETGALNFKRQVWFGVSGDRELVAWCSGRKTCRRPIAASLQHGLHGHAPPAGRQ
jgi:hypothetical protein